MEEKKKFIEQEVKTIKEVKSIIKGVGVTRKTQTISIKKESLIEALELVKSVASAQPTRLQELKCVRLDVKQKSATCEISGYDLYFTNISVSVYYTAFLPVQFSATFPVKETLEIIKTFDKTDTIHITEDNGTLTFEHKDQLYYEAKFYDIEEYPETLLDQLTEWDNVGVSFHKTSQSNLVKVIRVTTPAISKEESRIKLRGLFFHRDEENKQKVVAVDGHRLHSHSNNEIIFDTEAPLLIPQDSIQLIAKVLSRLKKDSYTLSTYVFDKINGKRLVALNIGSTSKTQQIKIITRVIDEIFPNYTQVIPTYDTLAHITVDRTTLMNVLTRLKKLGGRERYIVTKIVWSDGFLTLNTLENSEHKLTQKVKVIGASNKDALETNFITLNVRYLLDFINTQDKREDNITLSWRNNTAQAIIEGMDEESFAVIMPMTLQRKIKL